MTSDAPSELLLSIGAVANRLRMHPRRMEHRVRGHAPREHTWVIAIQTSGLLLSHDVPRISVHDLLLDTWLRNSWG